MATISTNTNIKDVTYAAGEALTCSGTAVLTIDAQDAADVAKVTGTLPGTLTTTSGTILIKNNSTTVPLVVKLSAVNKNIVADSAVGEFRTRGAWISIGTGSGADNQQINMQIGGVNIDWPPFVQVEKAAGSGALVSVAPTAGATYQVNGTGTTYTVVSASITDGKGVITCTGSAKPTTSEGLFQKVSGTGDATIGLRYVEKRKGVYLFNVGEAYNTMLNIGGNHNDASNAAYLYYATFADCKSTSDMGCFFEYDEYNGGAGYGKVKFGSASGGGWVPPNGANIRYPNIHITLASTRPITGTTGRGTWGGGTGRWDMEVTAFTNRFSAASVTWPNYIRFKDVGFCGTGGNMVKLCVDGCDVDGLYSGMDCYQGSGTTTAGSYFAITDVTAPATIKNVHSVARNATPLQLLDFGNVVEFGEIRGTILAKSTSQYLYPLSIQGLVAPPLEPANVGPLYANGGQINFGGYKNIRFHTIKFSDFSTGISSSTNSGSMFFASSVGQNVVIDGISLLEGGTAQYSTLFSAWIGASNENIAFHNMDLDATNQQTAGTHGNSLSGDFSCNRFFAANCNMTGCRATSPAQKGTAGRYPGRFSNYRYGPSALEVGEPGSGMSYELCSGTELYSPVGNVDLEPFATLIDSSSVCRLSMAPGGREVSRICKEASGGVSPTDYFYNGSLSIYSSGVTVTVSSTEPIRAITSMAGVTLSSSSNAWTGITHTFRMAPFGTEDWTSWYDGTVAANYPIAFDAMSGYDSDIGFSMQVKFVSTTAVAGRYLSRFNVVGLTVDTSFVPEVGTVKISVTNAEASASCAAVDIRTTPTLRKFSTSDVDGAVDFEFPYDFDGTPAEFRIVARKPGYAEASVDSQCYQAGITIPAGMFLTEAAIADSGSITFVGDTSATLGANKTLQQLYSNSQHASCLQANMLYDIPVVSGGNGAYTANVNVVATGYTLNGSGSLAMGAKTLTANDLFSYTYTGGTFSQATTVPTFSGGTLNIGAAGTYTYTQAAAMILSITPTAPGTYALGATTFTGQVDLRNTAAHAITVELPTGTSYTTASNTGGTITVSLPVVTADISITSMPNDAAGTTRLQIINKTALTAASRANTTAYSVGDIRLRQTGIGSENTAGLYLRCTTAGTSAGTPPTWNTTVGGTTTDGTVVWTTYAVLYYDTDPASTSMTDTYIDGEEFLAGEVAEIRFAEMNDATSFKTYSTEVAIAAAGFSALVAEEADGVYATNALDGSDYETTFSPDFANDYMVLDTNTDFAGKAAYAYFCYTLTTSAGMWGFWGGVTALDEGNYRINTAILNMYFDETNGFVKQTDDVRIFRDDGTRPAIDPTTGGHGIEINWRTPVSVVTTGGSAVLPQDKTDIIDGVWARVLPL